MTIACVYGSGAAAFVEPTVRDLARFVGTHRTDLVGVNLDQAVLQARVMSDVSLVYVLPFEMPRGVEDAPFDLLTSIFPSASVVNALPPHDLSCDRLQLSERLIERGVAVPETLVTDSPEEVRDFIRQNELAILREPNVGGDGGGLLVFCDREGTVVGEAHGRRYVVEFVEASDGARRSLSHGVLSHPPPFFVQRMVTRVGRQGVLLPAPVARAFVVDDHVRFWIESDRERVRRPSDFLLTVESGARRKFVQVVSGEAEKIARRIAKVVGFQIGVVDLIRSDSGYVVLEVATDGRQCMIDRSVKQLPEFREAFDIDKAIAESLMSRLY